MMAHARQVQIVFFLFGGDIGDGRGEQHRNRIFAGV
jgi:hypothetical protein